MTALDLSQLPNLPQTAYLKELTPSLWQNANITALWLGGSLAAGKGDAYSDIDLRIAVPDNIFSVWEAPDLDDVFGQTCLAHAVLNFDESLLHQALLENGDIYDLYVQKVAAPLVNEGRLILGCRDADFLKKLQAPLEPYTLDRELDSRAVLEVLEQYWLGSHKHRKALHRGLNILAWEGLNLFRPVLVRLAYMLETGRDCGDIRRLKIHGFSPVSRALRETTILNSISLPTRNLDEIIASLDALHEEVARVGRALAERYEFDYPERLEATVLEHWSLFKKSIMQS